MCDMSIRKNINNPTLLVLHGGSTKTAHFIEYKAKFWKQIKRKQICPY